MITPKQVLERVRAEVEPDRHYTAGEVAAMFGVNYAQPFRWARRSDPRRKDAVGRLPTVAKNPFRALGADLIAFAERRASLVATGAGTGVIAKAATSNRKIGRAAVTIVARQSCPASCPFSGKGCYAEHDNNRVHWDRVTAGALDATPLDLARAEADAIDHLPGDRDLRLHVAGDSVTPEGTRLIAAACERYAARGLARHGARVVAWAYTHGWESVARSDWGGVAVLASCEAAGQIRQANARGYAAAVTVPEFESDRAYQVGGLKVVPCPSQTRGVACTDCRLCLDPDRLLKARLAIGFAVHGSGSRKAREALRRVELPLVA